MEFLNAYAERYNAYDMCVSGYCVLDAPIRVTETPMDHEYLHLKHYTTHPLTNETIPHELVLQLFLQHAKQ